MTQTAQAVALAVIHADTASHAYLSGSIFLDSHVSETGSPAVHGLIRRLGLRLAASASLGWFTCRQPTVCLLSTILAAPTIAGRPTERLLSSQWAGR